MSIRDELKSIKEPCLTCLHLFHGSSGIFCEEEFFLGTGYCCEYKARWLEPEIPASEPMEVIMNIPKLCLNCINLCQTVHSDLYCQIEPDLDLERDVGISGKCSWFEPSKSCKE